MEDARSKEVNEDTNSRRCEAEKGKYWEALPEAIIKEEQADNNAKGRGFNAKEEKYWEAVMEAVTNELERKIEERGEDAMIAADEINERGTKMEVGGVEDTRINKVNEDPK